MEVDKNFIVDTNITETDIEWFDIRTEPFSIHGVFFDEEYGCFLRMPQKVADSVSPKVAVLNHYSSGGRVRFSTDSDYIAIYAEFGELIGKPVMTLAGESGFDLYKNGRFYRLFTPPYDIGNSYASERRVKKELADYEIYMPLYREVRSLKIALRKGAKLLPAKEYSRKTPVVFYGSSITQGACASRPGINYVNTLCRKLDTEFINLGWSGACKGEMPMMEYLASLDMSVFVYDFDHNVSNSQELLEKHMVFYKAFRNRCPDVPVIMATAPDRVMWGGDFDTRREIIYQNYLAAKSMGDNVYYLDQITKTFEGYPTMGFASFAPYSALIDRSFDYRSLYVGLACVLVFFLIARKTVFS